MATRNSAPRTFKKGDTVRFVRKNGEKAKGTFLGIDESGASGAWAKVKVDYKANPALVRVSQLSS